MLEDRLKNYRIILASRSPRRQQLLKGLGIDFDIIPADIDETYPPHLQHKDIALYLSQQKAKAFDPNLIDDRSLLITADTIVWLDGRSMPKPSGFEEAVNILHSLSGKMHEVITGVTIRSKTGMQSFHSLTRVWFKTLREEEIHYYINRFKPFDKAGAYGVQEWIGYTGIEKIEGSYFNVVGLPVFELYRELLKFN